MKRKQKFTNFIIDKRFRNETFSFSETTRSACLRRSRKTGPGVYYVCRIASEIAAQRCYAARQRPRGQGEKLISHKHERGFTRSRGINCFRITVGNGYVESSRCFATLRSSPIDSKHSIVCKHKNPIRKGLARSVRSLGKEQRQKKKKMRFSTTGTREDARWWERGVFFLRRIRSRSEQSEKKNQPIERRDRRHSVSRNPTLCSFLVATNNPLRTE